MPTLRDRVAQSWARSHNQRVSETSFQTLFYAHLACTENVNKKDKIYSIFIVEYDDFL